MAVVTERRGQAGGQLEQGRRGGHRQKRRQEKFEFFFFFGGELKVPGELKSFKKRESHVPRKGIQIPDRPVATSHFSPLFPHLPKCPHCRSILRAAWRTNVTPPQTFVVFVL